MHTETQKGIVTTVVEYIPQKAYNVYRLHTGTRILPPTLTATTIKTYLLIIPTEFQTNFKTEKQ